MPILAAFLGTLFTGLLGFFIKYLTKRVAVFLTVVSAITLLTSVFLGVLYGMVEGISLAMPSEMLVFSGFLPSSITTCLSIIFTARTLAYVYVWNVKVWQFKLKL